MKNESAESPKAAVHDAKFDIETPPGSATAADAHSTNPYFSNEEAGVSSKDVDNLATISLDTPSASDGDATFKETEQLETHQSTGEAAGAFEGLAPAATSTFSNISSAGSLPLSASLTQLSTSNSAAADLGVQQQSTAGLQPAQPPAVSTSQPAALPRASHVKVGMQAAVSCLSAWSIAHTQLCSNAVPLAIFFVRYQCYDSNQEPVQIAVPAHQVMQSALLQCLYGSMLKQFRCKRPAQPTFWPHTPLMVSCRCG